MDLKNSRIVVVNDDGIDAHGFSILEQAVRQHCDDVWVVAPAFVQSGRARAMTYRKEVPVHLRGEKRFAVEGTPSDCVIVALGGLIKDRPVDLVVSGINDGENVANDVAVSGTIGACFEAADQDVPAIAFSQGWGDLEETDWTCSRGLSVDLLPGLAGAIDDPRMVLNVNFPAVDDVGKVAGCRVVHCGWRLGPTTVAERPAAGGKHIFYIDTLREDKPNEPACDLDLLSQGYLTVTPLTLDQTDHGALQTTGERLRNLI